LSLTIKQLAEQTGVSTRAIRYYDQIGLLKPSRFNGSGYRMYGNEELDKLRTIVFYRSLELSLKDIKAILEGSVFHSKAILTRHYKNLVKKRDKLNLLVAYIDEIAISAKRGVPMSGIDGFEEFKKRLVDENERQYGSDIREKHNEESIEKAYRKIMSLTPAQFAAVEKLSIELDEAIKTAFQSGDPASEESRKACELHKQWLMFYWDDYTPEAHAGVARLYVDDRHFKAYYDAIGEGCAEFFCDAILAFVADNNETGK